MGADGAATCSAGSIRHAVGRGLVGDRCDSVRMARPPRSQRRVGDHLGNAGSSGGDPGDAALGTGPVVGLDSIRRDRQRCVCGRVAIRSAAFTIRTRSTDAASGDRCIAAGLCRRCDGDFAGLDRGHRVARRIVDAVASSDGMGAVDNGCIPDAVLESSCRSGTAVGRADPVADHAQFDVGPRRDVVIAAGGAIDVAASMVADGLDGGGSDFDLRSLSHGVLAKFTRSSGPMARRAFDRCRDAVVSF